MPIDCQSALERLAEPGGLVDPETSAHLAGCAECRGAQKALALLQATREEPDPRALAGFATRVRAKHLQKDERTRRVAPLRAALLAGALAAAGAAAVGLVLDRTLPLGAPAPSIAEATALDSAETDSAAFDLMPDDSALEQLLASADDVLGAYDDFDEDDEDLGG